MAGMNSQLHPSLDMFGPLLVLTALTLAYLGAAAKRRGAQRPWSLWRVASWLAGVSLLATASTPVLGALAHHDLRAHMTQHLLIGMFAPLALVLAAPLTLTLRTLPTSAARRLIRLFSSRIVRCLSHPLSAFGLHMGGMYLLYLTPLYAASLHSRYLHLAIYAHFLAAGYLFTWAIVCPDPWPHRPPWRLRVAVLFSSIAAHAILAKLMYAYGWPRGTPYDSAQLQAAAQIMYYGGDLAELLLAACLFSSLQRASQRRSPNWHRSHA